MSKFKMKFTEKSLIGTQAFGLRLPLIKEGDVDVFMNTIIDKYNQVGIENGDIVGITESVVARNAGMYINLEDVGRWIKEFKPSATELVLINPIFSRNRFLPILRGMLCADNITKVTVISGGVDEVGNLVNHQITGVDYRECYKNWIEDAGKEFYWDYDNIFSQNKYSDRKPDTLVIDCRLHATDNPYELTLQDIFADKNNWGLLGMNAAGNNRLKLFPDQKYSQWFVDALQSKIKNTLGYGVDVMIYGDGAYKDPISGIWEWADPVVSPAWTSGLNGMPFEMKLKNAIDSGMSTHDILNNIARNRTEGGQALGTTPRRIVDLLGSLMDLISGSGDKGTPVVVVRGYFKKYID